MSAPGPAWDKGSDRRKPDAAVPSTQDIWGPPASTIEQLIRAAAARHGIPAERALARAWAESKMRDVVRVERNGTRSVGPLQISTGVWPEAESWPVERRVDVGVAHLAALVRRYQGDAEFVYRWGHAPRAVAREIATRRHRNIGASK